MLARIANALKELKGKINLDDLDFSITPVIDERSNIEVKKDNIVLPIKIIKEDVTPPQVNKSEVLNKKMKMGKREMKKHAIDNALTLQSDGDKHGAVTVLLDFLKHNPNERSVNSLVGTILVDNNEYKRAIPYLEKSVSLNSQSELVYFSLYIAYVKRKKFSESIELLTNFLDNNPANLFRTALKELLIDLSNGYAIAYKDKIISYAKKNSIAIPDNIC